MELSIRIFTCRGKRENGIEDEEKRIGGMGRGSSYSW